MNVLVIDVGGSHIKILATGRKTARRMDSGSKLTAVPAFGCPARIINDAARQALDGNADAFPGGFRLRADRKGTRQ